MLKKLFKQAMNIPKVNINKGPIVAEVLKSPFKEERKIAKRKIKLKTIIIIEIKEMLIKITPFLIRPL